jgi:hypothetical protein
MPYGVEGLTEIKANDDYKWISERMRDCMEPMDKRYRRGTSWMKSILVFK